MSLLLSNVSVLAYANNFTLWHYKSEDSKETVMADGYFDNAADMMVENDLIITTAGGVTCFLIVDTIENGKVSVRDYA